MRSLRGEGKTCSIVGPDIHSPGEEVDRGRVPEPVRGRGLPDSPGGLRRRGVAAAAMTDRTDVAVSGSLDVPLAAGSAVLFHRLGPGATMSYA